jgi:hypothetical protein
VRFSARFFLFPGLSRCELFFQVMGAFPLGYFIFLSNEGSPARHHYSIVRQVFHLHFFFYGWRQCVVIAFDNYSASLASGLRLFSGNSRASSF